MLVLDVVLPLRHRHWGDNGTHGHALGLEHKSCGSYERDDTSDATGSSHGTLIFSLRIHRSRVLWRALRPLLFDASAAQTHRAVHCIFSQSGGFHEKLPFSDHDDDDNNEAFVTSPTATVSDSPSGSTTPVATDHLCDIKSTCEIEILQRRRLELPLKSHLNGYSKAQSTIVLWIEPPDYIPLEYYLTGLFILWEHRLILAQSLAGYVATLGGGFFLCHHFKTAIRLARIQQHMALLLNDEGMYYTCFVHQAYSHIYVGHFHKALSILKQLLSIVQPDKGLVLTNMCQSAKLFCRRMRRASLTGERCSIPVSGESNASARTTSVSIAADNFQRIRVMRDKSNRDDLVIPFTRAATRAQ